MTDKETMKMALEFIERVNKEGWILDDFEPQMYEAIAALKERLAQPDQEPYAYTYLGIKNDGSQHGPHLCWKPEYMDVMSHSKGAIAVPLYIHPPQRKPLTDEQISDLWCEVSNTDFVTADTHVFARAIEAAHGIKENT